VSRKKAGKEAEGKTFYKVSQNIEIFRTQALFEPLLAAAFACLTTKVPIAGLLT